jgi:hypothetical protein
MDWLSSILDPQWMGGFAGGLIVTAFVTQGIMEIFRWLPHVDIPARCALIVALPVGILVAWAWAATTGDKIHAPIIVRDGLINAAASTVAYENIVKPLLAKVRGNTTATTTPEE